MQCTCSILLMFISVFLENACKSSLFGCIKFRTEADELWLSYAATPTTAGLTSLPLCSLWVWKDFTELCHLFLLLQQRAFIARAYATDNMILCSQWHEYRDFYLSTLMCSYSCCNTLGYMLNSWLELSTVVFTLQWHGLETGSVSVSGELSQCDEDNLWMAIWPF